MTLSSPIRFRPRTRNLTTQKVTAPRVGPGGVGRFVGSLAAYVAGGAVAVEGARRLFSQAVAQPTRQHSSTNTRDPHLAQRAVVTGLVGLGAAAAAYGLRKNWVLSSLAEGAATHSIFDAILSGARYAFP